MLPLKDSQNRICAFSGRSIPDITDLITSHKDAKYINSPNTQIFDKNKFLFNWHEAWRNPPPTNERLIIVEGQLDAIRCWSVGIKTAIAFQGTAITEPQLALLRRYHTQVECLFDTDDAGQKAALRYLPLALKAGLETRFLASADPAAKKLDPDTLFIDRERAPAIYDELRRHSLSAMRFACRSHLPDPENASAERKTQATRDLFDIILNTDSEIARSEFLREIAANLRLPPQALLRDFETHRRRAAQRAAPGAAADAATVHSSQFTVHSSQATPVSSETTGLTNTMARERQTVNREPGTVNLGAESAECHLLLLCLHHEHLGPPVAQHLPPGWIDTTHTAGALLANVLNHFAHDDWPGRDHLDEHGLLPTDAEKTLVATLLFDPPRTDEPHRAANQALAAIRHRALTAKLREIELALATHHPESPTPTDPITLIKQRTEIQRQLRQPVGLPAAA